MKLRAVVSLLGIASLFAVTAQAQEERKPIDVFAGYSYLRANPSTVGNGKSSFSLNGGNASVAYNFNNWLGGVADFGGYHTTNGLARGLDGTLSTYLFGPRVSFRKFGRVTPFGEVLFGVAHTDANLFNLRNSQNAFAMTVGGGVDYRVSSRFAIRPLKVDYLLTRFNELGNFSTQNQNNLRVSTGIVFRF